MIKRKSCFTCKRTIPLFCYHTDTSNYKIKFHMDKVVECRICVYKRMKKDKGLMQRVNGKFEFVQMSRIEIIKYILKK